MTVSTNDTPRLKALCTWVALLSRSEADACIRSYRDGDGYSSEAVNHYGGATAVITMAIAMRHVPIVRQDVNRMLADHS